MEIIAYLIIIFGFTNLLRISLFLIGSDLYTLTTFLRFRGYRVINYPTISVIIPAFNEEHSIIRSIKSVLSSNYPIDKLEVIVIDDGSTDQTHEKVKKFVHDYSNIKLLTQQNSGKAHALNRGMREYADGTLVMCLDADSTLDKNALINAVKYFEDKKVVALASNIKIVKDRGFLNLIQQFEYMVSYQMKRAQTFYNIEYIIGGIGSMFRKSYLEKIGYYDTNTVTEDIDLTMKILRAGNRNVKVIYGSDVISYTPSAHNIKDLIRQRYRWKWGRYQTFLKNSDMFFSRSKNYSKGLTWFYLPFALFSEASFLLEPLFVFYIIAASIYYASFITIISAYLVISFYLLMNILAEDTIPGVKKIYYFLGAPLMYFLFYVISFVEYFVLVKALLNSNKLKESLNINGHTWHPVNRFGNNFALEYSPKSSSR